MRRARASRQAEPAAHRGGLVWARMAAGLVSTYAGKARSWVCRAAAACGAGRARDRRCIGDEAGGFALRNRTGARYFCDGFEARPGGRLWYGLRAPAGGADARGSLRSGGRWRQRSRGCGGAFCAFGWAGAALSRRPADGKGVVDRARRARCGAGRGRCGRAGRVLHPRAAQGLPYGQSGPGFDGQRLRGRGFVRCATTSQAPRQPADPRGDRRRARRDRGGVGARAGHHRRAGGADARENSRLPGRARTQRPALRPLRHHPAGRGWPFEWTRSVRRCPL